MDYNNVKVSHSDDIGVDNRHRNGMRSLLRSLAVGDTFEMPRQKNSILYQAAKAVQCKVRTKSISDTMMIVQVIASAKNIYMHNGRYYDADGIAKITNKSKQQHVAYDDTPPV